MIAKARNLKNDLGFATGQEMVRKKNSQKFICKSANWHLKP